MAQITAVNGGIKHVQSGHAGAPEVARALCHVLDGFTHLDQVLWLRLHPYALGSYSEAHGLIQAVIRIGMPDDRQGVQAGKCGIHLRNLVFSDLC